MVVLQRRFKRNAPVEQKKSLSNVLCLQETVVGGVRRFSPPLSSSLSFAEMFMCRFDNDNYLCHYRLSTFFAVIVPKRFEFQHRTLRDTSSVVTILRNRQLRCTR